MKAINEHHKLDVEQLAAFVAIDWADQEHVGCLLEAGSDQPEDFTMLHTPEDIDQWAVGLRERFGGKTVAVWLRPAMRRTH